VKVDRPDEVFTVAAERRLLEKPRHELVTFDLVNVLLSQRASSLHAEPGARPGSRFDGLGPIGVVADGALLFNVVARGVIVCHLREEPSR